MDSDDDLSLASSAELEVDDNSSVGDFGQGTSSKVFPLGGTSVVAGRSE